MNGFYITTNIPSHARAVLARSGDNSQGYLSCVEIQLFTRGMGLQGLNSRLFSDTLS